MLQEVSTGYRLADRLRDRLAEIGLTEFLFSGDSDTTIKKYGNVIASRWRVTPVRTAWPGKPRWPQLLARATVQTPKGELEVIGVHIPNGSGNGWKKIETLEALAAELKRGPRRPRIVAGDFNEPKLVMPGGNMLPFGHGGTVRSPSWDGIKGDRFGEEHPRTRWRDAVLNVLDSPRRSGVRHAYLELYEGETVPTHKVRGRPRFFDHILVSDHFRVVDAGFEHVVRKRGLSDHSLAWASLRSRSLSG